jgi:hypothetical protein
VTNMTEQLYGEDSFSDEGAYKLKCKIERYWKKRGHDVKCTVHHGAFIPAIREAHLYIRSDMINGLPRGYAPKAKRAGRSR